jgi:hypothetical protein
VAPDQTDILVFTDESGDDQELLGAVTALAKTKKSKVNLIWTESR